MEKDDTISRQDAIDAVEWGITLAIAVNTITGEKRQLFREGNNALRKAAERIKELPSAQAEIIRCKDCNHWSRESIYDGFCSEDCMRHDEDFYCGYAERKTNE